MFSPFLFPVVDCALYIVVVSVVGVPVISCLAEHVWFAVFVSRIRRWVVVALYVFAASLVWLFVSTRICCVFVLGMKR